MARRVGVRRDRGMVTAELAVALPVLVLVVAGLLAGVGVGVDQVRCVDAAATAARSLARGDPPGRASGLARRLGPTGAEVAPSVGADLVVVRVSARRTVPVLGWSWTVGSTAVAAREVADGPPG